MYKAKTELDQIICDKLTEGDLADIQFKHYPALIDFVKTFAMDCIHDSELQDMLFADCSGIEEIAIETEASKLAGEDGATYWNAYFIPQLGVILQVTATDEQDAQQAYEAYVKENVK